jgi:uncharacterized protein YecT (DUF1311 family)
MKSTFSKAIVVACLVFLGGCLTVGISRAADDPCYKVGSDWRTTSECVMDGLWNAQSDLDAALKVALSHSDRKHAGLVKTAQRDWAAYVESECQVQGDLSRGGTEESMDFTTCESKKYRDRIKELKGDFSSDNLYGDGSGD